jgi:hypothetical protein
MNGTLTAIMVAGRRLLHLPTARRAPTARRGASAAASSIARPNACATVLTGNGTRSSVAASRDACRKSTRSRSAPAAVELPIGC